MHISTPLLHHTQWLEDVAQKVMLDNEEPVPVILLANKVSCSYPLILDPHIAREGSHFHFCFSVILTIKRWNIKSLIASVRNTRFANGELSTK